MKTSENCKRSFYVLMLAIFINAWGHSALSETISSTSAAISIDNRSDSTGCRIVECDSIHISSSKSWFNNCAVACVLDGIEVLSNDGCSFDWNVQSCGTHILTYQAKNAAGETTGDYSAKFTFQHNVYESKSECQALCLTDGNTKEEKCRRCGEIVLAAIVLPALGHCEVVTTTAKEPMCTQAGRTKGSYCNRCQSVLCKSSVLPALGHQSVVSKDSIAATCTIDGHTEEISCGRCKLILVESTVVPDLGGHVAAVTQSAVAPTSGYPGRSAETRCSRCNELLQVASEIPALGYVRNVKAQQLWPHNKVALEYTVAEDVGELGDSVVSVWCAHGSVTNRAKRILGDLTIRAGVHQIVWDMEADGLKFEDTRTAFGVNIQELGGVQLWENGPYWAECNIGASKPEEYGYYFWWGDTVGYKRNAANNGWVSVGAGKSFTFTASNCPTYGKSKSQLLSDGCIDSRGNLVADQDSATAHMGVPWRMPTDAEFAALIKNCTTTWTARNGVYGRLVTGKGTFASKSIFLPSAGYGVNSGLYDAGSLGMYWSSSPYSTHSESSAHLNFYSEIFRLDYGGSYCGHSVRPLRIK